MSAPQATPRASAWRCVVGVLLCGIAFNIGAQEAPPETPPETPPPPANVAPWTYSLGLRTDMDDLRHPGTLKLHLSLGLRYGRWRIGQTDGSNWHRFGQVLQDSNLTYDVKQDDKWSMAISGSIINLDHNSQFDALKAGRKTLRAKAGVSYRLPNRWSVGLVATQDVFMRGDGTTLSPTLAYRQPLSEVSTLLFSQSMTWGNSTHWQTQQAREPLVRTHQGSGFGEYAAQLTLRRRLSPHWAVFSQVAAQHTLSPVMALPLPHAPNWTYSAQVGLMYFDK